MRFITVYDEVYCKLCTVMKRAYFMTVIDGVFCLDMLVINSPETRFNRHA